MHDDVFASSIDRVWQAGVSDEKISDVSVLLEMVLKHAIFFSCDDVN